MCLSLMSVCCENDIVPFTMPFIKQHIVSVDWKARDAAVMALGKGGREGLGFLFIASSIGVRVCCVPSHIHPMAQRA